MFAVAPDGRQLFVSNEDDNLVSFVDLSARRVTREVPVGVEPEGMGVSPDGKMVVATSESSSMVHLIDRATGDLIDNLPVDTRPRFVSFSPDGERMWVSSEVRGTVTVFDVASRKRVGLIDFEAAQLAETVQPVGIVFTRDGRRAFVALGRGNLVAEVEPRSLSIIRSFAVGQRAWQIALSPDDRRLYSANGLSGDISIVDLATNRVSGTVQLGGKPWGIAVAP
jgi:PQQ-dependent catabolism-associated beta-propeller protein